MYPSGSCKRNHPKIYYHPDVPLFPLCFPLFRKLLYINRIQRLIISSLHFCFFGSSLSLCLPSYVCGSVCLQRSCLSQRLHCRHIGLIAPQGAGPRLWTVGRHRCHPDSPLVFGGDELQLLAQLEVSSRSSSASFNLPLTHLHRHLPNSPDCTHFPAKESNISPHWLIRGERTVNERGILWFPVVTCFVEGSFSYLWKLYYILHHPLPPHFHLIQPPLCVCTFMFRLPLARVVHF